MASNRTTTTGMWSDGLLCFVLCTLLMARSDVRTRGVGVSWDLPFDVSHIANKNQAMRKTKNKTSTYMPR